MKRKFTLVFYVFLLSVSFLNATNYYVNSAATGANNGSSWADAYTDLQSALSASTYNDTIFVAAGIYKPGATTASRFNLPVGGIILGGFAGTEDPINAAVINSRDFSLNETILSGDVNGNDNGVLDPLEPTRADNCIHVVYSNSASVTPGFVHLDGFTISDGNGTGAADYGAGIYLYNANPTLKNLIIKNNTVEQLGAGLYIRTSYAPMDNIIIENNFARSSGGGIYSRDYTGTISTSIIRNNTAGDGSGLAYGGGMYNYQGTPVMDDVKFIGNAAVGTSTYGGGIYNFSASPNMTNMVFAGNTIPTSGISEGGGMYSRGSVYSLVNATVILNQGTTGAGLCNSFSSTPTLTNVIIYDNVSGAGMLNKFTSIPEVDHCMIEGSGGSTSWVAAMGNDNGNNIDGNPFLIMDSPAYTVPLVTGSPALSTGNTTFGTNIGYYQGAGVASPSVVTVIHSIADFGSIYIGESSAEQSFTVEGTDLFEDIIIAAPAGFELTTTSANYSGQTDTIILSQSGGIVATTTIFIRFTPALIQSYSDNAVITSATVSDQTIALTGVGVQPPQTITVVESITDFGGIVAGQFSAEQSYTVEGVNLVSDISISVPAGFQITTVSGDYSGDTQNITLAQTAGIVNPTTVYVRFAPLASASYSESILHQSSGASDVNIALTGTGLIPVISVNPSILDFGSVILSQSSAELSFDVSGSDLIGDVTITAPADFQITTTSGDYSGITDQIALSPTGYDLATTTVYARFVPSSGTMLSESISLTSTDAVTEYVNVTGDGLITMITLGVPSLDFGSVPVGDTSAELSYIVSGDNLLGDITINAPADFQITSVSGDYSGNTATITLSPVSNTVNPTNIFIRFLPLAEQSYSDVVVHSSTNVTNEELAVTAEGVVPVLILSATDFTFDHPGVGNSSQEFSYTVEGTNLQGDLTISAPAGFEISLTSGVYTGIADTVVIPHAGGTITVTDVFVRFTPSTLDEVIGDLKHEAAGVADQFIALQGNVAIEAIYVDPITPIDFGYVLVGATSSEQSFRVAGENITDSIYISAPAWFEISLTSGDYTGITNEISLYPVGYSIDTTLVYVRFTPQANFYYDELINITGFTASETINVQGTGAQPIVNLYGGPLNFGTIAVGGYSPEQSYVVAGSELVDAVTIVAPEGIQLTTTLGDYTGNTDTIILPYSGNPYETVYARFAPQVVGPVYDSIMHISESADTTYMIVTGTGELLPAIIITGTVSYFGSVAVGESSAEQSYFVEGTNLTDDINIYTYPGFEVSLISGDFTGNTSLITLPQSGGVVLPTEIFVRFTPLSAVYYNENIDHASTGAADAALNVSGTGVYPPRIFVDDDAVGANNGYSWADAFTNLQDALSSANYGDTIFVAQGTYLPSTWDRSSYFNLVQGTVLLGGFQGNEFPVTTSVIENRDFINHESVLSGDLYGNDNGLVNNDENSYHIVYANGASTSYYSNTVLDGFTIRGGNANGTYPDTDGGAMYITAGAYNKTCSPTFKNLRIEDNYGQTFGGAVHLEPFSNLGNCSPTFTNCDFENNWSDQDGGAVYVSGLVGVCSPVFDNVRFINNYAYYRGGAVYNMSACGGTAEPIYSNVLFAGNSSYYGGAMTNLATDAGGSCQFSGGYLYTTVFNATFIDNNATVSGNAIYNEEEYGTCNLELTNAILWDNGVAAGAPQMVNVVASPVISYSDIQNSGGSVGWDGSLGYDYGYILDEDPLFLDAASYDVTLIDGSVALNTGLISLGNNMGYYQGPGFIYPMISLSPQSIDFGIVDLGFSSAEYSYWVTASSVYNDLTITAPAGFEITLISGDYTGITDVITLSPVSGNISQEVFIRFTPLAAMAYAADVTHSSSGANTQYLAVTGTGNTDQGIIISGSLNSFGSVPVGGASAEQSYMVEGVGLTDDITITAPADFEISLVSGDYTGNTTSISLPQNSGVVNPTTVFIRFTPSAPTGYFDYVVHSSTGVTNAEVAVWGSGYLPPYFFVNDDAVGANDGSSWENAFNDLQDALAVAGSGDSIFVAAGIYTPHGSLNTVSFDIPSNVKVFGGFVGSEAINAAVIAGRNIAGNETVLSGDLLGNDNGFSGNTENSYHVVTFLGSTTSNTVLDGFTIQGGNADGTNNSNEQYGGGILIQGEYLVQSSPVLRNMTFRFNYAKYGGALYATPYSTSGQCNYQIYNSRFENNQAVSGGAIYNFGAVGYANPLLDSVEFVSNYASSYGAAMYNWGLEASGVSGGVVSVNIRSALFFDNACSYGGIVYNRSGQDSSDPQYDMSGTTTFAAVNTTSMANQGVMLLNRIEFGDVSYDLTNVIFWNDGYNEFSNLNGAYGFSQFSVLQGAFASGAWDNTFGYNGGFNDDEDPVFVDMNNGDYSLMDISPAIGTGDFTYGQNKGYYQGPGIAGPIIMLNDYTTDFGWIKIGESSPEQYITILASNLTDDLVIDAPVGFEISLSSGDFSGNTSQITIPLTSGDVPLTTVYVRFSPVSDIYYFGNLVASSTGANDASVVLSGNGGFGPLIGDIQDIQMCSNQAQGGTYVYIYFDDYSTYNVDLTATSNNQSIVPDAGITLSGWGDYWNIYVNPVTSSIGTAEITLTATSFLGLQNTYTFNVTLTDLVTDTINYTSCEGNYMYIDTMEVTQSGTYYQNLQSYFGCDSLVVYNVVFNTGPELNLQDNYYLTENQVLEITMDGSIQEYFLDGPAYTNYYYSNIISIDAANLGIGDFFSYYVQAQDTLYHCYSYGYFYVHVWPASIEEQGVLSGGMEVYPNPGNGEFTLTLHNVMKGDYTFSMVDVTGREIYSNQDYVAGEKFSMQFNLPQLSPGIYYLIADNGNENGAVRVVIR